MNIRLTAALGLSAALLLSACQSDPQPTTSPANSTPAGTSAPSDSSKPADSSAPAESSAPAQTSAPAGGLKGEISGMGASSMRVAQDAWLSQFMNTNPGLKITYAAEGSGAGRKGLQQGSVQFAGSDRAFKKDEQKAGSFGACAKDSLALDLPIYVSPIAIIFKLDGVTELNLDAETLAKIFKEDITKWNDPAIAALNEGVQLPDEFITVVRRGDTSGTTENLADYLKETAPNVWDAEVSGDWPYGGQAMQQTDGVKQGVTAGNGTIGYVDASAAEGISTVKLGKDGTFYGPDAEAAAKIVENSPLEEGREANDLAVALDRKGDGYPIVLIAYGLVCQHYADQAVADNVKAYMSYIISEDGQKLAHAQAGSAPLSRAMADKVQAAIDSINA